MKKNPNYIKTSQNNIYMAVPNINDLDCSPRSSKLIFIIYSSVMIVYGSILIISMYQSLSII